jgi:hypothetical protein
MPVLIRAMIARLKICVRKFGKLCQMTQQASFQGLLPWIGIESRTTLPFLP